MFYVVKFLTTASGGDDSKVVGVHGNENSAMVQYHGLCRDLRNDNVTKFKALVMVFNELGKCVIMESIDKMPAPEPAPEEETET